MLRLKLDDNPEIEEEIISAIDSFQVLRTRWEENHRGGMWPG
jgi:hypothetical protein